MNEPTQPSTSGSKKTWYIIGGIVIVAIIWSLVSRFALKPLSQLTAEKAVEKAMEQASGGKAKVDLDNGKVTVSTDEGTAEWGGNKLPDNWPSDAPIYPNSQVQFSGASNQNDNSNSTVVLQTSDSGEKVLAYYKQELVAKGWKIESTYEMSDAAMLGATKDKSSISVTIGSGGDQKTSITVSVGTKQ